MIKLPNKMDKCLTRRSYRKKGDNRKGLKVTEKKALTKGKIGKKHRPGDKEEEDGKARKKNKNK